LGVSELTEELPMIDVGTFAGKRDGDGAGQCRYRRR
jgi:hypothetical protein